MSIGRNTVRTPVAVPVLQYANGKSMGREVGQGRFTAWVGFHMEVGKDEALDAAMRQADIPQCEIRHQREGGSEIVRHWNLGETVRVFPLTSGPVSPTVAGSLGRNAQDTADAGIGVAWPDGERSKAAVRVYLEPLVRVGYVQPVQFAVRSRMSDVLIAVLADHTRVCEAADQIVNRTQHPEPVSLVELALPLGAGEEQTWGKGDTAQVIPFVSLHPEAITADYIRDNGLWRPDAVLTAALRNWAETQAWAHEYQAGRGDGNGHE